MQRTTLFSTSFLVIFLWLLPPEAFGKCQKREVQFIGEVTDSMQATWVDGELGMICHFKVRITDEFLHVLCPYNRYKANLRGMMSIYDKQKGCPLKGDIVSGYIVDWGDRVDHEWGWEYVDPQFF